MGRFAADDFLYLIEQGTASAIGTEFLRQLVRHLAKALDARYAFICEYVERGAVLTRGPLVEIEGLTGPVPEARGTTRPRTLEELQRVHILKVIEERDWVIEGGGGAAAVLGLGPSTLRYRMQKLGIKRPGGHSR